MDEVKGQEGNKTDEVKKQSGETPEFVKVVMSLIGGLMIVFSLLGGFGVVSSMGSAITKGDMGGIITGVGGAVLLIGVAALGAVVVSVFGKGLSSKDEIKKNMNKMKYEVLHVFGMVLIIISVLLLLQILVFYLLIILPLGHAMNHSATNALIGDIVIFIPLVSPFLMVTAVGFILASFAKKKLKKIEHGDDGSHAPAARIETMEVVQEGGEEKKEKELPPMLNADPDVAEKAAPTINHGPKIEPNNS